VTILLLFSIGMGERLRKEEKRKVARHTGDLQEARFICRTEKRNHAKRTSTKNKKKCQKTRKEGPPPRFTKRTVNGERKTQSTNTVGRGHPRERRGRWRKGQINSLIYYHFLKGGKKRLVMKLGRKGGKKLLRGQKKEGVQETRSSGPMTS